MKLSESVKIELENVKSLLLQLSKTSLDECEDGEIEVPFHSNDDGIHYVPFEIPDIAKLALMSISALENPPVDVELTTENQ